MTRLQHPLTATQLQTAAARPSSAYLFIGSQGSGRHAAALWLARELHCANTVDCKTCKQITIGSHPDLVQVRPNEKNVITMEAAAELKAKLNSKSQSAGSKRMVIIENADKLSLPAQNSLLKIIEEPAAGTTFVLTTSQPSSILTTIRSRCQNVYIRPVGTDQITAGVKAANWEGDSAKLAELSLGRAGWVAEAMVNESLIDQELAYRRAAQRIVSSNALARLADVDDLAKSSELTDILRWLLVELQTTQPTSPESSSLQAYCHLVRNLDAKVAPKHALNLFMVSL